MKLTSNNIKQTARALFKRKRKTVSTRLIKPRRDWTIGLLVGCMLLVGIMAWSAYMYTNNRSGDQLQNADASAQTPVYRAAVIEEALGAFTNRQTEFTTIQRQVRQTAVVPPEPTEVPATTTNASSTATTSDATVATTTTSSTPSTTTENISTEQPPIEVER